MAAPSTTPSTTAESSASWYGGRRCIRYRQRVIPTSKSFIALGFNVPAYSRVVHTHLRTVTTGNVTGAIGATEPNAVALLMCPVSNAAATTVLTQPPSTASLSNPSGTNGYILAITPGATTTTTATSETNGVFRGPPAMETMQTSVEGVNRNPTAAFLCLVPAHTSSNRIQVNTAATDSGYFFGTITNTATSTNTSGTYDAVVYVETYDDYPT